MSTQSAGCTAAAGVQWPGAVGAQPGGSAQKQNSPRRCLALATVTTGCTAQHRSAGQHTRSTCCTYIAACPAINFTLQLWTSGCNDVLIFLKSSSQKQHRLATWLTPLLLDAGLSADESIVQLHVERAELHGVTGTNFATFVELDFFQHATQATPVMQGPRFVLVCPVSCCKISACMRPHNKRLHI